MTGQLGPEQTGIIGHGQVDLLVTELGHPHVIMEAKIGLKPENIGKRFDSKFLDGTGTPLVVFEVKYEEYLKNNPAGLAASIITYCVHRGRNNRFPKDGWLRGSVRDVATAILYSRFDAVGHMKGATILGSAISKSAKIIGKRPEATLLKISNELRQEMSKQTWGMAALVLSGAITFHDDVAEHNGIPTMGEIMRGGNVDYVGLLEAWERILDIDFFPIFDTAKTILEMLVLDAAVPIIRLLVSVRDVLASKDF